MTAPSTDSGGRGSGLGWVVAAYLLFLIYGSLLPFQFEARPLAEAMAAFRAIPYLDLGAGSRADWVANILLYIPAAYLLAAWLGSRHGPPRSGIAIAALVAAVCLALALVIEFTQLFFVPRTVSMNDLVAEATGTFLGLGLWLGTGGRLPLLAARLTAGGGRTATVLLFAYLAVYVFVALFPYDFVVSGAELKGRMASDSTAWLLSSTACDGMVRCLIKVLAEALVIIPVGLLFHHLGYGWRRTLVAALVLGALLELCQLLLVSGVVQGFSVGTRGVGVMVGYWLYQHRSAVFAMLLAQRRRMRLVIAGAMALYLPAALWLTGAASGGWGGMEAALAKLGSLRFLPFYYHYFTTETVALASALHNFAVYVPVGVALWTWRWAGDRAPGMRVGWTAAGWGLAFALIIETAKLFGAAARPDPTNLLLAALAAAGAASFLSWVGALSRGDAVRQEEAGAGPAEATRRDGRAVAGGAHPPPLSAGGAGRGGKALALLLLAAVAWSVWDYPVGRLGLAAALTGYGLVLWLRPQLWIAVVLLTLVALDLSPWSGRLLFDEMDLFILVTLAYRLWHGPFGFAPGPVFPPVARLLLALLAVSITLATVRGLWPPEPWDGNAMWSYWTGYGALRAAKGILWAFLLLPLVREFAGDRQAGRRALEAGLVGGLAVVSLLTAWERVQFSGLWNFANEFRVTGTFATMHTGGSHLEAYLALSIPLVLAWSLTRRNLVLAAAGLVIVAAGSYALMVTFARAGYAAAGAGILSMLALLLWSGAIDARRRLGVGALALVALAAIGAYVVKPVLQGSFAQARLAVIGEDLGTRLDHWSDTLAMMDGGWSDTLLGKGMGQFPRLYLFHNPDGLLPATYRFMAEDGNRFLRLGSGDNLYFEQIVDLEPDTAYVLSFEARTTADNARLTLPICEKALLYSFRCRWRSVSMDSGPGGWHRYEVAFDLGDLGSGPWYSARPVKLSMFNSRSGTVVDVDDVSLKGPDGSERLVNGDFGAWGDRWFFVTDNHLPWHIKQMALDAYFSQGLVGLLTLLLLGGYALYAFVAAAGRGDWLGAGLAGGFVGFGTVGLFGSPFDTPRLSAYVLLLFASGLVLVKPPPTGGIGRGGPVGGAAE